MDPYILAAAVGVGLFSSLHCVGMCGSIIGALSLGLPETVRQDRRRLAFYVVLYNGGRIASYACAGALLAVAGRGIFQAISPEYGHLLLQWVGALVMMAMGAYLAGWFPLLARAESLGRPLWRWIEPLGRAMLPVHSPLRALSFGLIWGWLPCGLVYAALIYSTSAGSPLAGAGFMTAFGLGTLPATFTAGILGSQLARWGRVPSVRLTAGLLIMVLGGLSLLTGANPEAGHEQHFLHLFHQH